MFVFLDHNPIDTLCQFPSNWMLCANFQNKQSQTHIAPVVLEIKIIESNQINIIKTTSLPLSNGQPKETSIVYSKFEFIYRRQFITLEVTK